MYQKNFDKWNEKKKNIDISKKKIEFHEREIWYGPIGVNVGSEQDGIGENFERPILVYKRLSPDTFYGIPFSTKKKLERFQEKIIYKDIVNYALLDQMRIFDIRRLDRKIDGGKLDKRDFENIKNKLKNILGL